MAIIPLLVLAFSFVHSGARAWSGGGHMLAALLAYRQLTPPQQQAAVAILRKLPAFDYDIGKSVARLPRDQQDERIFLLASIWPDLIRDAKHPAHREHRPVWHVTWMPIGPPGYPLPNPRDRAGNTTDTMDALPAVMREFQSEDKLSPEQRAIDLAWVLHMIGDLHCPIHSVAYYDKDWPMGDDCGALFMVRTTANDPPLPLHKVWDALFGHRQIPINELKTFAASISADPLLGRQALASDLREMSTSRWIEESSRVAAHSAYLLGSPAPLRGTPSKALETSATTPLQVPVLPAGYKHSAMKAARKCIALAGYRIADFLRASLN